LEYYDGNQWVNVTSDSPEVQTGGTRAVKMGGYPTPSSWVDTISYFNMATTGNAIDFGNLGAISFDGSITSSRTRQIYCGGYRAPQNTNGSDVIEYVTISSTGDAIDFGDLTTPVRMLSAISNGTRGVIIGGYGNPGSGAATTNVMQYVTLAQTGNTVDFGDLTAASSQGGGNGGNSPTRGVFCVGTNNTSIEYITTATTGNSADFGDETQPGNLSGGGHSNAIRMIYSGAYGSNMIGYITMATLGDSVEFGDCSTVVSNAGVACSPTRACIVGGRITPSPNAVLNTIQYVQIMTTGNAVDFGDTTQADYYSITGSNGHGGLG